MSAPHVCELYERGKRGTEEEVMLPLPFPPSKGLHISNFDDSSRYAIVHGVEWDYRKRVFKLLVEFFTQKNKI